MKVNKTKKITTLLIVLAILAITLFVSTKRHQQTYKQGFDDGYTKGFIKAANERLIIVTDTNIRLKINGYIQE